MPTIFQTLDRNGQPHRNWRYKYIDYQGNRRSGTGLPTKEATKRLANKIQSEQDEIRNGLKPAPKESDRPRLFTDVAAEYLAWGESQGGHGGRPWSKRHRASKRMHLRFWQEELNPEMIADLIGCLPQVEDALRQLQGQGRSGKTLQNCAEALASFCDWAIKRAYLDNDPLKNLSKFDTTPTIVRRAPTAAEIQAILHVASPERRLLYEVALTTGLRANELRSLRVRHLDIENSGLKLEASWTKGRRANFQPLHPALVKKLAPRSEGKALTDPLLKVPMQTAKMLYRDLERAGVPRVTSEGILDFHALRVAYVTLVFEVGASVKEAQTSARHSTPDLTANVYARTRSARLSEIAQAVGDRVLNGASGCPTGVQQPSPAMRAAEITVEPAAVCSSACAPASTGSNPVQGLFSGSAVVGLAAAEVGQSLSEVGHQSGLGGKKTGESRSAYSQAETEAGLSECPMDVQRASGLYGFFGQAFIAAAVVGTSFSGAAA